MHFFTAISVGLLSVLTHWVSYSQVNYITNGDFEKITGPVFISGLLELAEPWRIESQTPDLYHVNASFAFLRPPILTDCDTIVPSSGNAFAGLSGYSRFEKESFSAPFNRSLNYNTQYYVSMNTRTDFFCPESVGCLTDGIGLAFVNKRGENDIVLDLQDPLLPSGQWHTLEQCYTANGEEVKILIKHFRNNDQTNVLCTGSPSDIFSYFYIDDVIVAPFDIVPDVLYLCKDDEILIDTSFFGKELFWHDNIQGGTRVITSPGIYVIHTRIGDCLLTDTLRVVQLDENPSITKIGMCQTSVSLSVELPYNTIWENGQEGRTRMVYGTGIYVAYVEGPCGVIEIKYDVQEIYCDVLIVAPNIFNPFTSLCRFYISSHVSLMGNLSIFDRWGNLLFNKECSSGCDWDGTLNGKILEPQVVVWMYEYSMNGVRGVQSGDVTIIR